MKRMRRPWALKALSLAACLCLLGGCTASIPVKGSNGSVTLPPPRGEYTAPLGDAGESFAQTVMLCLPSAQNRQLQMFPERILLSHSRHPADYTLRKLFSFTGTTAALPLTDKAQLSLSPGSAVETSGQTATVNLAAGALALDNKERYLVSRAIANTLTQWGDIRFVNVLVNGRQLGVDTASTLPLGSLTRTGNEDVNALWEAMNRQAAPGTGFGSVATLYFPAKAGRGVLAEAQAVNFTGNSLPQMALALLQALSAGPQTLTNAAPLPDLVTLLSAEPEAVEQPGAAGRTLRLRFYEGANEALISAGVPRSILMAALTFTLTTFLPYTTGIEVSIGAEQVNAVVPAGLYEGAGEEIIFERGVMQRSQFAHFLLDECSLYFPNAFGSLSRTSRAIPYYQTFNPRYLFNQLALGPVNTDSVTGLSAAFPAPPRDADLLGISRQGDASLVNLSGNLRGLTAGLSAEREKLMVYALVNTLSDQRGIRRVRFFIDGKQEGTFAGSVDVAGEFLRNEGIIRQP